MKHTSVQLNSPIEFINVVPLNPLISKVQIKVCYVGDEPNRNRSVITKETAKQMANSLPGCPIVGFYNEGKEDFEEHNRIIDISNGEFKIKDTTRPYGFVDLNAKVWFAKFIDDDTVEREYMVTEGWIWNGVYPEADRILTHGNNQSMELDENTLDAEWTKDNNGKPQFFIINEAVISKLCILGEENEPCFEGSNITKIQFSFEDGFKEKLFSMINELKDLLNEGGAKVFTTYAVEIGDSLWSALYSYIERTYPGEDRWCSKFNIEGVYEEEGNKFAVLKERATMKYYRLDFSISEENGFVPGEELVEVTQTFVPAEEPQFAEEAVNAYIANYIAEQDDSEQDDTSEIEDNTEGGESEGEDDSEGEQEAEVEKESGKDAPAQYSLEDIPEYGNLLTQFAELQTAYAELEATANELRNQLAPLVEFKNGIERANKEAMIAKFYMLSDEDKKDVIDNIDTYSLDDIEAKLCVICVRNKVNFAEEEQEDESESTVFNLNEAEHLEDDTMPAWVKAALDTASKM